MGRDPSPGTDLLTLAVQSAKLFLAGRLSEGTVMVTGASAHTTADASLHMPDAEPTTQTVMVERP
jgi:hypothetical protein